MAQQSRAHVNLWDLYCIEEELVDELEAWKLCQIIAEKTSGRVMVDTMDVCLTIQNDLFSAVRLIITLDHVLNRFFESYNATEVIHFSEMSETLYWDPPAPPGDIFNAMVAWHAETRNIKTDTLSIPSAFAVPVPPPEAPAKIRSFSPDFLDADYRFLSFAEASYCFEQRELLHGDHPEAREWMFVTSDAPTTQAGYVPATEFRSLPFNLTQIETSINQTREALPELLKESGPSCITDNSHIQFIWDSWAGWLREGAVNMCLGRFPGCSLCTRCNRYGKRRSRSDAQFLCGIASAGRRRPQHRSLGYQIELNP